MSMCFELVALIFYTYDYLNILNSVHYFYNIEVHIKQLKQGNQTFTLQQRFRKIAKIICQYRDLNPQCFE